MENLDAGRHGLALLCQESATGEHEAPGLPVTGRPALQKKGCRKEPGEDTALAGAQVLSGIICTNGSAKDLRPLHALDQRWSLLLAQLLSLSIQNPLNRPSLTGKYIFYFCSRLLGRPQKQLHR